MEANKKARQQIEELRRDQKKFHAIYSKMNSQLGGLKEEIREEEDACKDSFHQR